MLATGVKATDYSSSILAPLESLWGCGGEAGVLASSFFLGHRIPVPVVYRFECTPCMYSCGVGLGNRPPSAWGPVEVSVSIVVVLAVVLRSL